MRAFLPMDIAKINLLSSTIPEFSTEEPAWDADTAFADSAIVSYLNSATPKLYKSLVANNLGNDPATSPTKWIEKSYTNRFRMFKWEHGHVSKGSSPMTVTIRPRGVVDAVMLGGLSAETVRVEVTNGIGGNVIFSRQQDLRSRQATTPYEWFYLPWEYATLYSNFDIPPSLDPVITMTLTSLTGICEIERFAVGQSVFLGDEEWDAQAEDEVFSDIDYDERGTPTLLPVPGVPTAELELILPASQINRVNKFKRAANARVACWSGMQRLDAYRETFSIFGVYQRFPLIAANHKEARFSLKIMGV